MPQFGRSFTTFQPLFCVCGGWLVRWEEPSTICGWTFHIRRVFCEKEFKIKLQGNVEGRKGKLRINMERCLRWHQSWQEFTKSAGDTLEYAKFCEEDVRPALTDIVWSWRGISELKVDRQDGKLERCLSMGPAVIIFCALVWFLSAQDSSHCTVDRCTMELQ
ncbi:hypothetical protein FNV43_RR07039 [Rhamnella rubrinervis]|uniref:Uncharacterized protein n=1 Tax=Rhamnella rubrinervis TaxID=2594499 RepID=A0A8K0MMK1_9ROSA|nr:hypothetical protein FNV43_RR07039 [Rhamnella rubrinervis]